MTLPISLVTAGSPLTRTCPWSYASTQCFRRPSAASSLKWERETETSMRASPAGSFSTFGPGTSMRQIGTSPRARSSSRITSFSCLSAGTSAWRCSTACLIRVFVSPLDTRRSLDLVALQQLLADHHALDLGGALADQQQRGVAVEPLDLVLLRVAVAAVDAEGLLHDLLARLRREQLRHAGLEVGALPGVLHTRGLQREQPGGLDLRGHVGELELDRLVLSDRLSEGLALLRVTQGELERALGDAHSARGHVHAADLERVHHLGEALAETVLLAAQDALGRADEVVVDELRGLHALVAHLLDLGRHRQPVVLVRAGFLLGDEARHAAVRRIGPRIRLHQHEHETRAQPVRDPHLLTVQPPEAVVRLLRGRLDPLH